SLDLFSRSSSENAERQGTCCAALNTREHCGIFPHSSVSEEDALLAMSRGRISSRHSGKKKQHALRRVAFVSFRSSEQIH
ncbi:MAG TPA: hypothetical protein VGC41_10725, partial [Kofleriaceae bacterium]